MHAIFRPAHLKGFAIFFFSVETVKICIPIHGCENIVKSKKEEKFLKNLICDLQK